MHTNPCCRAARRAAGALAILLLAAPAPAPAADKGAGSVWKVRGEAATVYLAGTVHLLREEDHPLPKAYDEAYKDSRRLVFEVDLEQLESLGAKLRIMELGMLPDGVRLRDRIAAPLYTSLQAYLKDAGIVGDHLDRLTPAMMAMTVTSLEAARLGARADLGVETVFDRRARKDGKTIAGLESPDFQMRLFDQFTAEEQEELLRLTIENIRDTRKDLGDLIAAWKAGDAAKLDEVLNRQFEGHERLTKVILDDRNRAWLPSIEKAMKDRSGNSLFLVGVGHLVGKQGVIRLLENAGHEVTRVGAGH